MKLFGNSYSVLLADCEKRLEAALGECARLRNENEQLRQQLQHNPRRPNIVMVGSDDDAGEFGYRQSDGGW